MAVASPQGPLPLEERRRFSWCKLKSRRKMKMNIWSLPDAIARLIVLDAPITFFGYMHLQGGFFANGNCGVHAFRPEYRTVGEPERVPLQLKGSRVT